MLPCVRGIIAGARSPHSADATRCRIRIATPVDRAERFAHVVPRPRRPTDFPSMGRDELRSPIGAKLRRTKKTYPCGKLRSPTDHTFASFVLVWARVVAAW